jgi:hypothetical protein
VSALLPRRQPCQTYRCTICSQSGGGIVCILYMVEQRIIVLELDLALDAGIGARISGPRGSQFQGTSDVARANAGYQARSQDCTDTLLGLLFYPLCSFVLFLSSPKISLFNGYFIHCMFQTSMSEME